MNFLRHCSIEPDRNACITGFITAVPNVPISVSANGDCIEPLTSVEVLSAGDAAPSRATRWYARR